MSDLSVSDASIIDDPHLVQLMNLWLDCCGDKPMPERHDVDMLDIPMDLLPFIIMADVLRDENGEDYDYRFRLVSIKQVEIHGYDVTGALVSELSKDPAYSTYIAGLYKQIVREKRPLYVESDWTQNDRASRLTERLMLPLSNDGENVDIVLTGQVYPERGPREATAAEIGGKYREYLRVSL